MWGGHCLSQFTMLSLLNTVAFALALTVGLGIFIRQIAGRFNLLRAASGTLTLDRIPERIRAVLVYAFGQKKFVRPEAARQGEAVAGWMHFFIFWGFTLLGAQVIHMFGRMFVPTFTLPFLSVDSIIPLGGPYLLIKDVFQLLVLLAIATAFTRWLVTRPKRLYGFSPAEDKIRSHSHWEAFLILGCISMIMIGGFLYDGGMLVAHGDSALAQQEMRWQPLSKYVGAFLLLVVGAEGAGVVALAAQWLHNLAVLVMLNFLPQAKHFHVITVAAERLLPQAGADRGSSRSRISRTPPRSAPPTSINSPRSRCSTCSRAPSAGAARQLPGDVTGKPLAPRQLLLNLRDYLYSTRTRSSPSASRAKPAEGEEPAEVGKNVVGNRSSRTR